jgi:hypothetical protein
MAQFDQDLYDSYGPGVLLWRNQIEDIPPPYVPPVLIPPVVDGVDPAEGVPLTKNQPVAFDVTDNGTFRRILLTATFIGALAPEVIYDGTSFSALYSAGSTQTGISGGYRFSLLRAGGWPGDLIITPYAFDTTGQENV